MRPAIVLLLSLVVACTPDSNPVEPANDPPAAAEQSSGEDVLVDPRFTDTLRTAARDYPSWGRVDEQARVAPLPCADPTSIDGVASRARLSAADEAPHGRKLYFLFAGLGKQAADHQYLSLGDTGTEPIPVGFAIVKQSWTAVPSSGSPAKPARATRTDVPAPITWIEHEGGQLEVGEQAELFVMAKVGAPDMPGTDAGWIYGTLAPKGRRVTSAGRVQSCMDCHEAAPHERLFGLR